MSEVVRLRWAMICFTVATLLAILLLRIILTNDFGYIGGSWKGSGTAEEGGLSAAFMIDGDATAPISPGITVPLDLRFTNPHPESLSVSHLRVTMHRLIAPNADSGHPCSARDYRVTQLRSSVEILLPPSATTGLQDLNIPRKSWPQVGMLYQPYNQDGCRGATLKLSYTAFGTLVS
jgi:hypothetical protein